MPTLLDFSKRDFNVYNFNNLEQHMRYPANICLFKVNNRSNRKKCEICSKLTIKTPERRP